QSHRIGLTGFGLDHVATVVRTIVHARILGAEVPVYGLPRPDGALGSRSAGQNQRGRQNRRHQHSAHGNLLGCDAKNTGRKCPTQAIGSNGTRFSAAKFEAFTQKHTVRSCLMTSWNWSMTASVETVAA